jgi:preprotein translocase subunit YajC
MDWFISTAAAQAAGASGAQTNPIMQMLPLLLIFVVFYFMLIRPQSKRAKEHRVMLAALEVGTEIATAGGIVGKVTEVGENFVTVEIAANVLVKVQRSTISQVLPKGTLKGS